MIADKAIDTYQFLSTNASNRYKRNYKASLRDDFAKKMIALVRPHRFFRIHTIGHFYSAEYFQKWKVIAGACPHTIFIVFIMKDELTFTDSERFNIKLIGVDFEGPNGVIYTDSGEDCPKTGCGICLKCLSGKPVRVGNFPFM